MCSGSVSSDDRFDVSPPNFQRRGERTRWQDRHWQFRRPRHSEITVDDIADASDIDNVVKRRRDASSGFDFALSQRPQLLVQIRSILGGKE